MSDRRLQKLFVFYADRLRQSPQPLKNLKAIDALSLCRTPAMGSSYYRCDNGHPPIEHNHSCRHRSCYLCAHRQRLLWIEQQKQRLYNTGHFHVIFTVPHEYLPLWRYNEAHFARMLFSASQQTLLSLVADKHNVTPGLLMTLHTWGRQLSLHPHTHCLITAGGLDNNNHWHDVGDFLLPGGILRRVYRGKLQALIRAAFEAKELTLPPDMSATQFWRLYRSLYRKEWSVRVQPRYTHGRGVLLYLARYCKGGPVHPQQIQWCSQQQLRMRYHDHRSQRVRQQTLEPLQFLQNLLQHVPPTGLHTVRYYGLYAPAAKQRYQHGLARHGNLAGLKSPASLTVATVLLYCKTCGKPAKLVGQRWRYTPKGNSLIKAQPNPSGCRDVQQGDESDIDKQARCDSS